MIYPKGKIRHQNLMTAYTDLSALLSTLKTEEFSGTIEMEFPDRKGILFVDSGEIINAEVNLEAENRRMTGSEAIRFLLALSGQKDGVLNLYQLSPEQVVILANHLQHEVVFKGLSTDFTRIDRLLLGLKDEKHTGFIEFYNRNRHPMGVLFFQEGEPAEMYTTPDSGPSVFGRKSIPALVEEAVKQGALLNVYRTEMKKQEPVPIPAPEPDKKGEGLKEMIPILEGILMRAEKLIDGTLQPGSFRRTFKKVLIEKSNRFPFLDPFGGELDYRNGSLLLNSGVGVKELTEGLGESLKATFSNIEEELSGDKRKKIFPLKLRAEMESFLEPHRNTIKRLDLDSPLLSFL